MRTRTPLALILALLVALLAASTAEARLTTKLMVGKDAGLGGLGLGYGQLLAPADADVGPGGETYVLVPQDCSVRVFDGSGSQIRQFGTCPQSNFSASGGELLTNPQTITVDAKSRVYVGTSFYLTVTDKDGNVLHRFNGTTTPAITGTSAAVADADPSDPTGSTSLYIGNSSANRVDKYSVAYDDNSVSFDWAAGENVDSGNVGTGYEVCSVFAQCVSGVSGAVGFSNPTDLDIATSAGPLFVVSGNNNVIGVDADTGLKIGTATLSGLNALSVAARGDGGFWVAPAGIERGELLAFDASGTQIDAIGSTYAPSAATDGIGGSYGIGSTTDGRLVVADSVMHRAGIYDSDGDNVLLMGKNGGIGWQRGSGSGEFSQASDAVSDGAGGFWVLDYGNKRVVRFSGSGTELDSIDLATIGSQSGISPYGPAGMGINAAGTQLYVADSSNHRVIRFDVNVAGNSHSFNRMVGKDVDSVASGVGTEVCTVVANCQRGLSGGNTPDNGSFNYPIDVAVSPNGANVWVVEQNSQRMQRFDTLFNWGSTVGSYPADSVTNGKLANPQAIAFESDSSFWVSDYSGRVQNYDASGTFVKKFRPGNGIFGVSSLVGLAVSGSNIYVVESELGRVAVYPTSTSQDVGPAAPASTFGAIGSNPGQFFQPRGIATSGTDFLVADQGNSRVQLIGQDLGGPGAGSITFDSPTAGATIFNKTQVRLNYTAVDPDGNSLTCTPASGSMVALSVGANDPTVSCDDPLGDAAITNDISITRVDDLNAPIVVIDTPVDGSTQTTNSAVLDFGVSDDQDPGAISCDRTSGDSVTLAPGANAITVSCTDWAGNVGTATANVTYTPPTPPSGGGTGTPPSTPTPTATIKFPKKQKFKGTISATVTCDMACPLVFTVTAKVGKKKYTAKAKATLTAAGTKVLRAKFKKSATKAILKPRKLPKISYSLTYGAKAGKSGAVKASK